jgi:hypothetical protein
MAEDWKLKSNGLRLIPLANANARSPLTFPSAWPAYSL